VDTAEMFGAPEGSDEEAEVVETAAASAE